MWSSACWRTPEFVSSSKQNSPKKHPVIDLLSVRVHENEQEAIVAEVALWNLWAGKLKDPQVVRGGRINAAGKIPYPPRGWPREKKKPAKEEKEENEQSAVGGS